MFKNISLSQFKCFKSKTSFDLSKLNLLTGINGRGKSSLIQPLLLLSQTNKSKGSLRQLLFNGEFVELGTYDDVVNSDCLNTDKSIIIDIQTDVSSKETNFHFRYKEDTHNERAADLDELTIDNEDMFVGEMSSAYEADKQGASSTLKQLRPISDKLAVLNLNKIHYISADRLGPSQYVKKDDTVDFDQIGIHGENAINLLARKGNDFHVHQSLCLESINEDRLLKQATTSWLSYILDGANFTFRGDRDKTSCVLSMMLASQKGGNYYLPTNVGFGYSYILPLIITGLISQPGDTVIVENPEAHLHPSAQSRLMDFFSRLACADIQVFIETHSEHILNGLRLCALRNNNPLKTSDCSIYYFNNEFNPVKLDFLENGRISNWQSGFFDQQENDLAELMRLSCKNSFNDR